MKQVQIPRLTNHKRLLNTLEVSLEDNPSMTGVWLQACDFKKVLNYNIEDQERFKELEGKYCFSKAELREYANITGRLIATIQLDNLMNVLDHFDVEAPVEIKEEYPKTKTKKPSKVEAWFKEKAGYSANEYKSIKEEMTDRLISEKWKECRIILQNFKWWESESRTGGIWSIGITTLACIDEDDSIASFLRYYESQDPEYSNPVGYYITIARAYVQSNRL